VAPPPRWLDASGYPRPVRPCPRCGREAPRKMGGLRGPQGLEAAAPRWAPRRPLYRGPADAAARPQGGGAGPDVQGDDGHGPDRRAADGPRHAPVHGDTAEGVVGGGPDVRGDLARLRVRRLRDRCVLAADRRLAGVELAAQRSGALRWSKRSTRARSAPGPVHSVHGAVGAAGIDPSVGSTGDTTTRWRRR
jgi:hypothetical protein